MKLESIQEMWDSDSVINPFDLAGESIKIPKLHSKYYKLFSAERMRYLKMESEYKQLKILKFDWIDGKLSKEQLAEMKWEPVSRVFLKGEIPARVDTDKQVIDAELKLGLQREKIDFLESIIKSLVNRGFQIKAAIDWERFKSGG